MRRRRFSKWNGQQFARVVQVALLLAAPGFSLHSQETATGVIEGSIRLAQGGSVVERRVQNLTDPEICGPERVIRDLRVSGSAGLADVLVWLESDRLVSLASDTEAGAPPSALPPVVLDNVDCEFAPQALTIETGRPFRLDNSDSTLHTVHWRGPTEENVALPLREVSVDRRLDKPGLYSIRCDVHPWMRAWVRVDMHGLHAATDLEGAFRIARVPPGVYTLVAWHERLGEHRETVSVTASRVARVGVTMGSH